MKYPRHMFMIKKCFTAIKGSINYIQLSNLRKYFSTYFCMQPDVKYYDLVFGITPKGYVILQYKTAKDSPNQN